MEMDLTACSITAFWYINYVVAIVIVLKESVLSEILLLY